MREYFGQHVRTAKEVQLRTAKAPAAAAHLPAPPQHSSQAQECQQHPRVAQRSLHRKLQIRRAWSLCSPGLSTPFTLPRGRETACCALLRFSPVDGMLANPETCKWALCAQDRAARKKRSFLLWTFSYEGAPSTCRGTYAALELTFSGFAGGVTSGSGLLCLPARPPRRGCYGYGYG